MPFVRYRPVRCSTPGTAAASAGGYVAALSVAGSDCPFEEPARGNHIACRRHVRIDYLATLVDAAIDVVPAAADPSVGLVDSPVLTHGRSKVASWLAEQRQIALHPAIDGALINQDAVFGQPF